MLWQEILLNPYIGPVFAKWRWPLDDATLQIKVKCRPIHTISLQTPLAAIMSSMCRFRVRALPVADQQGKVGSGVSGKTTHVVTNDRDGSTSKLNKARDLNLTIWEPNELETFLGLNTAKVPVVSPSLNIDTDSDGVGNAFDYDDDGDGINDHSDAFPLNSSEWLDTDLDGIGNEADTDDDNDGIPDISDPEPLNPLNDIESKIDYLNNTVNDIQNRVIDIQLDLDNMNASLADLHDVVDYLNQTIPTQIPTTQSALSPS